MDTRTKTVFNELYEAARADAKFKVRGKGEARDEFLRRLVERIAEVPQEQFDKLSPEAQKWYNEAVDRLNEEKALDPPAGYGEPADGASAPGGEAPAGGADGKKVPAAKKTATKKEPAAKKTATKKEPAAKKTATKKTAEPKERKGLERMRPRETPSVGRTIREALVEDQSLSADDLREVLGKAGFKDVKKSTISTMTADILRTLMVAAAMGKFKANPAIPAASK